MNIEDYNIESMVEMRISGTTLDGEPVNIVFPVVDANKAIIYLNKEDSCETSENGETKHTTIKKRATLTFDYDDIILNQGGCDLCRKYGLEDGDTLYISSSWDGGISYDYINNIHFCPRCGRRLK